MATALNLSTIDYILECDKELDESEQTIFLLKPLSAAQQASIQDAIEVVGDATTVKNFGTHSINLLKKGLVGWKNFKNASGDQLKFNNSNKDANINIMPAEYRYEIAGKIMTLSTNTDDEVKN